MTARATARLETRRVSPAGATGSADREAREERSASRSPFQTIGEIAGAGPRAHLQLLGRERLELHAALTLRHLGRWKSRARRSLASHAGGELLEVKRISQPKKRDGRYHAHESRQKSVCACFLPPSISRRARRTARARLRATTRRRSCAGIETRVHFWRSTRVFSWRGFRARSSASPRTDRAAPRSRTAQA